jgi:hypothetical protein
MFWRPSTRSLTPSQLWTLAAGGILTKLNDETFEQLAFSSGETSSRICLRDWWSVNGRDDLLRTLTWLLDEGHRLGCQEKCRALAYQDGRAMDDATSHLAVFVRRSLPALQGPGLMSWDLSRLVNVARWGYTAKYVSEAETWKWMVVGSRRLQKSFGSWQAAGRDFMLGFDYWSLLTGSTANIELRPSYEWLLTDRHSPWMRLPWNTTL